MSSLLLKSSIALMALVGSMMASSANAEVCAHGERSDLRVSVYVQDRLLYVGDATLEATIVPFSAPSDEAPPEDDNDPACEPGEPGCDDEIGACDPEVEDCDQEEPAPCDPETEECEAPGEDCDPEIESCNEQPEPIVEVAGVPVGQRAIVAFTSGQASIAVSVPGFESVVVNRTLCGPSSLTLTLMPATTSVLTVQVAAANSALSTEGAEVLLVGEGARAGQRFEAEVIDGEVVISDIPAGIYSLEIVQSEGAVVQRIRLSSVDLFDDSTVSVRLSASDDLPSTKETCSTSNSSLTWMSSLLALVGIAFRRRRVRA